MIPLHVTINEAGVATGSLTIPRNTATAITAVALRANGSTVTLPGEFRLDLFPPASITFGRTGNFAGTLTGSTAGTFNINTCDVVWPRKLLGAIDAPNNFCSSGSAPTN